MRSTVVQVPSKKFSQIFPLLLFLSCWKNSNGFCFLHHNEHKAHLQRQKWFSQFAHRRPGLQQFEATVIICDQESESGSTIRAQPAESQFLTFTYPAPVFRNLSSRHSHTARRKKKGHRMQ